MNNNNPKPAKTRMVHVRLTEETHKRLRIRAAETEKTLQDWVAMAVENELDDLDKRNVALCSDFSENNELVQQEGGGIDTEADESRSEYLF